ncbi:MAG: Zn-ribbon domain-containing OB-fold protein [Halodesulfurarchaeum sp.]
MSDEARNAGYDDFLDAIEEGAPYYLACPEGHGSLPPRNVCPECGAADLEETPLPAEGTILAHNVVHVPTPRFREDTPYVTAIVDFGPVAVTGQVRELDHGAVENGAEVELTTDRSETEGDRLVAFRPLE